jgi:Family of unknown function (DUF5677)
MAQASRGREIGERLLAETTRFDIAVAISIEDRKGIAVRAMISRARRLLRGIFTLADAGMDLEAMVLVRALVEFTITLAWLLKDPELAVLQMAWDDSRGRRRIHDHFYRLAGVEVYSKAKLEEFDAGNLGVLDQLRGRPAKLPPLEQRAIKGGLEHLYASAYRAGSQAAAHPTIWGMEQLMEGLSEQPAGQLVIHPDVPPTHPKLEPYEIAVRLYGLMVVLDAEDQGDDALAERVRGICSPLLDTDALLDPGE